MLSSISDRFHTWAKGWLILSIIAAFVLLVNLPLADPTLVSMSSDGQFAYTPEQAFSAVASHGDVVQFQIRVSAISSQGLRALRRDGGIYLHSYRDRPG
jgi:hypothetical protein